MFQNNILKDSLKKSRCGYFSRIDFERINAEKKLYLSIIFFLKKSYLNNKIKTLLI